MGTVITQDDDRSESSVAIAVRVLKAVSMVCNIYDIAVVVC